MTIPDRAFLVGACLVAMCLGGSSAASLAAEHPPAAPEPLPLKEFMAHVIAYSAQNIWDKQGWITDQSGQRSLFPKNDEEWEDAESAALTLSEIIGLLLQPGRRMNVPGWDRSVAQVHKLSRQAAAAAEKHDEAAFFRIGTEIDMACESCHRAVGLVQ